MKMTEPAKFNQPISEQIWRDKYKFKNDNPDFPNDEKVEDTWSRVAKATAKNQDQYNEFYAAMEDFKFLPAGRIIAGAGTGRDVTLFNCYVMGTIPDSMVGIFDMLKEAALTLQQGGGIGYDFTPLRPKNSLVKGVDADASGPTSFMDVWDAMCRTIMSAGARRGAMMATMRCDHPDIVDFITAKKDPLRLRMFNVSVLVTDAFMEAVKNDHNWDLIHSVKAKSSHVQREDGKYYYSTIKARDLWDMIIQSTYDQAEPGVIFIDRINKENNLWYLEEIAATNPCGEQPLPPYGACLLGSINLTKFVINPFTDTASINYDLLTKTVESAVKLLDAVIDVSNFPIPQQKAEALYKRRMGLGVTGLADMLAMLKIKYGSEHAVDTTKTIMDEISKSAYYASIQLAKDLGPCPATLEVSDREKFIKSGFMSRIPKRFKRNILEYGIRNSLLTSIAPTGTISLYAGNVSSGIEPIFAPSYTRKVLEKDGSKREEQVMDYAVKAYHEWRKENDIEDETLPDYFVTAQTLKPIDHLVMQAAAQEYVDSAISKTINCPKDISSEDFKEVYEKAYELECKGCTTYRPNDITGSVISVDEPKKEDTIVVAKSFTIEPIPRNMVLEGMTYKLKWGGNNTYLTFNHTEESGKLIPFEMFLNSKNMGHFQWAVALTRMVSAVFRRGGDISFVVDELKSVMDPSGGEWIKGKYVPSFVALMGSTLENYLSDIGYNIVDVEEEVLVDVKEVKTNKSIQCSSCSSFNVKVDNGCPICLDCSYSKCG